MSLFVQSHPRVLTRAHISTSTSKHQLRSFRFPRPRPHSTRGFSTGGQNASQAINPTSLRRTYNTTTIVLCSGVVIGGLFVTYSPSKVSLDSPLAYVRNLLRQKEDDKPWKGKVYPALSLDEANKKLKAEEQSITLPGDGELDNFQFYTSRLQSNSPTEDTYSYESADVGASKRWHFWGVYDGHAGWATSRLLAEHLTTYVARALRQDAVVKKSFTAEAVDHAIKSSFLRLDDQIMSDGAKALTNAHSHADALSRIAPARAGSCALLAIFDPDQSLLRVACVGDSRAVLGRQTISNPEQASSPPRTWTAEALSEDQTGFNESERQLIESQHPGEKEIFDPKTGRLLGIAVTRAFGDHRFKWSKNDIVKCEKEFFGTAPRPRYESPPYMTAEPVITTTKINKGDFLILASDGFWDHVSSEDAIECVSQWIHRNNDGHESRAITTINERPSAQSSHSTTTTGYSADFKSKPEHFVTEDDNVATHLVRNALGGSRRDLFCSVMSAQPPESRSIRDDVTVQVVFFGQSLNGSS